MTKVIDYLKANLSYILIIIAIVITAIYFLTQATPVPVDTSVLPKDTPKVSQKDTLSATYKETKDAPDLVADTTYVAIINGNKVAVPVATKTNKVVNDNGATDITATVTTEVDLTNLMPKAPNWELGVGVGAHEGDMYIPVSLQRNYKRNRAVYTELHLDPSDNFKVNGIAVQYKVKF